MELGRNHIHGSQPQASHTAVGLRRTTDAAAHNLDPHFPHASIVSRQISGVLTRKDILYDGLSFVGDSITAASLAVSTGTPDDSQETIEKKRGWFDAESDMASGL